MADAPKNYYDILGIKPSASQDEIKARYKFLVKAFHPDRYTIEADKKFAEANMRDINAAYKVLSDADERKDYDFQNGIKQKSEKANQSPPRKNADATDQSFDLKEIIEYVISVDLKWQPRIKKLPDTALVLVYYREIVGIFHSIAKDVYPYQFNKVSELREHIDAGFFRMMSAAISLGIENKENGLSTKYDQDDLFFVTCSICALSFNEILDAAEESGLISSEKRYSIQNEIYKNCMNAVLYCFHLISSKTELISRRRPESEAYSGKKQSTPSSPRPSNPKPESSNPHKKSSIPDISVPTQRENNGCGLRSFFYVILVIVILLVILDQCDGFISKKPSITPTQVSTQKMYFPLPTNTQRIVYPTNAPTPRPTSTPDCSKWDQITTSDEGKNRCVYGIVRDTYFGNSNLFFIRFGPNDSDFRLLALGGYYYKNIIGKCVTTKGKVKTFKSLPYIEVHDNLKFCNYFN